MRRILATIFLAVLISATAIVAQQGNQTIPAAASGGGTCSSSPCAFLAPFGTFVGINSATSDNIGVNALYCADFYLPVTMTVNTLYARVITAAVASHVSLGIYSLAGAKLIDSTALVSTGTGNIPGSPASLNVILPGSTNYSACYSTDVGTVQLEGYFNDANTSLANAGSLSIFKATNSTAAGVMPATLGTRLTVGGSNGASILLRP